MRDEGKEREREREKERERERKREREREREGGGVIQNESKEAIRVRRDTIKKNQTEGDKKYDKKGGQNDEEEERESAKQTIQIRSQEK